MRSEKANAPPPLLFGRRGVRRRLPPAARSRNRTEGARDAKGPKRTRRPRCLAASRRPPSRRHAREVKSASPPFPRRPARGVYRLAPHGPRWTDLSGDPPLLSNWKAAYPPLSGPGRAGKPVTGRRCRHHGAQWRAAGAPGHMRLGPPGPRIASPMQGHSPATAPRPVSEDAVQTPLGTRRDARIVRAIQRPGISFFAPCNFNALRAPNGDKSLAASC